jgi:molecular chaperone GrpE (heat shock protein)
MKWLQSLLQDAPSESSVLPADSSARSPAAAPETRDDGLAASAAPAGAEPPQAGPAPDAPGRVDQPANEAPAPGAWPADVQSAEETAAAAERFTAAAALHAALGGIEARQEELAAAQRDLRELFQSRIRTDEVQAKALETLHDELRQYKTSFLRQQMLPLLNEVIFCQDFLAQEIDRLRSSDSEPGARDPSLRTMAVARQMLLDLLFKFDVEPYRVESEQFDPKQQQCAKTVPTGNDARDKQIAARGLEGFRSPEGIVRREHVTVYKFTPGAD